jgi:hypothetical protein
MSPVTPKQSDNFTKPCPKHNIEMIKFYCHDHKALVCSVCVTLEHTATSCKVNYISDISGKTINSKECQNILKDLNDMADRSSKTFQDLKKMSEVSNKFLAEALTDILKFRTKINQRLDEMERQVKDAAKAIQEDNSKNLKIVETACRDVSKSLKTCSDAIEQFNISKEANDLFMELIHAEQMIKELEKSVDKLSEFEVKEYNFEPNEVISNLLEKEKSLGTLKGGTLSYALRSRQSSQIDKICIKTSKDRCDCWVTAMTFLTPDLLIITDNLNCAIKIVDISKKSVKAKKYFEISPWDVTSVSENEVAVTFPDNKTVEFFSVYRNNLKQKHTLNVDGKCYGIVCHKDKMVVSYCKPAKVQILLSNGTVLQTIQNENIFQIPEYITTNDNCIYVSDFYMKTVTKLNWQCDVKGKYVCADVPRGLITSDDGTVFVCYCDSNIIEEISGDCSKGQVVVKDIQNPQSVYWSAETCTLYASSSFLTKERHFIKLFKLSK